MSSRKSILVPLAVLLTIVDASCIESSQGRAGDEKRGANSPAAEAKPATPNVASDLAKLRGQWAQELHDKELDKIIALYAPDAALLAPSGGRFTGPAAIRGLFKTIMDTVTSNITFHSIVMESSGDLAYDSGDYSETLVPTKNGPINTTKATTSSSSAARKTVGGSSSSKSGPSPETTFFPHQSETSSLRQNLGSFSPYCSHGTSWDRSLCHCRPKLRQN